MSCDCNRAAPFSPSMQSSKLTQEASRVVRTLALVSSLHLYVNLTLFHRAAPHLGAGCDGGLHSAGQEGGEVFA